MTKNWALWALALILTLVSAAYQRMTGPTYPLTGHVVLGGQTVNYRFDRTHETVADQAVRVQAPDRATSGELHWRRYPSSERSASIRSLATATCSKGRCPASLRAASSNTRSGSRARPSSSWRLPRRR
jgi:hypothetical protein